MLQALALFCWLLFQPTNSIFLSHQTSNSQPAVIFSHNKPAPATSRSQQNRLILHAHTSCGVERILHVQTTKLRVCLVGEKVWILIL